MLIGAKHDRELSDKLHTIGKDLGIGVKFGSLPFGASDAVPFTRKQLIATSFMSFDLPKLPSYYHTRLDTPDVVDKESLGQVVQICTEYVKYLDKKA